MICYNKLFVIMVSIILMSLSACAPKKPETREVIVYKTKEVYIPVPCDVEVTCSFKGDGFEPTNKLLDCVVKLKHALEYCKQTKEDKT